MNVISVFGSSRPKPLSEPYLVAEEMGRLLAENNFAVSTGGYYGTMEAASKGANDAGGHVIGITSDQIEAYRPLSPNSYIIEEFRYPNLRERLLHLVLDNDGMICLPGGVGTLAEFALVWNFMEVSEIELRPFICVGDVWRKTVNAFADPQYVSPEYIEHIQFVESPAEAMEYLLNWSKFSTEK